MYSAQLSMFNIFSELAKTTEGVNASAISKAKKCLRDWLKVIWDSLSKVMKIKVMKIIFVAY